MIISRVSQHGNQVCDVFPSLSENVPVLDRRCLQTNTLEIKKQREKKCSGANIYKTFEITCSVFIELISRWAILSHVNHERVLFYFTQPKPKLLLCIQI